MFSVCPTKSPSIIEEDTCRKSNQVHDPPVTDNGIFDFLTADKAIEFYTKIHNQEPMNLEWKSFGYRQMPIGYKISTDKNDIQLNDGSNQNKKLDYTEFDFHSNNDEELTPAERAFDLSTKISATRRVTLNDVIKEITGKADNTATNRTPLGSSIFNH